MNESWWSNPAFRSLLDSIRRALQWISPRRLRLTALLLLLLLLAPLVQFFHAVAMEYVFGGWEERTSGSVEGFAIGETQEALLREIEGRRPHPSPLGSRRGAAAFEDPEVTNGWPVQVSWRPPEGTYVGRSRTYEFELVDGRVTRIRVYRNYIEMP